MDQVRNLQERLIKYYKFHPDFPKEGINFWSFVELFKHKESCKIVYELLSRYAETMRNKVDVVVGIDSKGFILGPLVAQQLGVAFVPIRKKGKLCGETISTAYSLEYGNDVIEIQKDCMKAGSRVIIIDDMLATGGTIKAALDLVARVGGIVLDCIFLYIREEIGARNIIPCKVTGLLLN